MSIAIWRTGIVSCLLAGCTVPAEHAALKAGKLPALVQAHRFAYQGDLPGGYQLSPDGRKLAWTGPFLMRSSLHVRDNQTGTVHRYRGRARDFQWSADSTRLLYASDRTGGENTHVYVINVADGSSDPVDLTPYPGVKASIHQITPSDPAHVLIRHNRRDRRLYDLYRVNLSTGQETMIAQNPGDAVMPVTARDGRFVSWQRPRESADESAQQKRRLTARQPILSKKPEETFRVLTVSADRSHVWALSSRGRDRIALVTAHPALGWEKVIFEDPEVDVTRVVMSRVSGMPLMASAQPGYPRDVILDPTLRDDLKALFDEYEGAHYGLEIVSFDAAEKMLVVSIFTSTQRSYYLVDRATRTYAHLGNAIPADLTRVAAPMRPISIDSRDGLRVHGYLTLPRGVAPNRLPTVILVHGGPWARASWSDPMRSEDALYSQFLANRGYAVLQVNFRGSAGYGQKFMAAGMGEFAGKMQEDLEDAARWAIEAGITDPARVAIMGWSYGGYAALVGLTKTPTAFACGVSLGGPTDLASLIESFPVYWSVDLSMWHDFVGDPGNPEERSAMSKISPLHHAEKMQRPVLIVQGANDVRVRPDQARRMVDALRQAGKQVEYLEIADMGHAMGYWGHQLKILRKTEHFLHHCLGGRSSRFDPFDVVSWIWSRVQR